MSIIDRIRTWFGGGSGYEDESAGAAGGAVEPEGAAREMITCHDALKLVQEYLDGELEGVSRERVRAHFDVCGNCYPHLKFEASFLEAVKRGCAGESAPEGLRTRVAELIAQAGPEG